jgi:uncharacterized RmlC-like cupin family protein
MTLPRANEQTTQTPGFVRQQLITRPGVWIGLVHTPPGSISGWHHHGDFDTYIYTISGDGRLEFGLGGTDSCVGNRGDLFFIPKGAVHRESNPGSDESVALVVRLGRGESIFNVLEPAQGVRI